MAFEPLRLKRVMLIGDHHQLPPVVKNPAFQNHGLERVDNSWNVGTNRLNNMRRGTNRAFSFRFLRKYGHLDQSLYARFVRLKTPTVDLNLQGRARQTWDSEREEAH